MKPIHNGIHNEWKRVASYSLLTFFLVVIVYAIYVRVNRLPKITYKKSKDVELPQFNIESGFYNPEFLLEFKKQNDFIVTKYTVDGSEPNDESIEYDFAVPLIQLFNSGAELSKVPTSPRWKMPIGEVEKCVIVRARNFTSDGKMSDVVTKTFFISKANSEHRLPIISIVTNPKNLFDHKKGIYIPGENYYDKRNYLDKNISLNQGWWRYPGNYLKRGKNSFRNAELFYFENKNLKFSSKVKLKVSGQATRAFSQKSMNVFIDNDKTNNTLYYRLFENDTLSRFKNFVLRNGGNDWEKGMMRDALIENYLKKNGYYAPAYKATIVFIDGEYWGIHWLCERLDENYFASIYATESKDWLVQAGSLSVDWIVKSKSKEVQELMNFVKSEDFGNDKNYFKILKKIDIQNYIDYTIAELFFANTDWPMNNVMYFNYTGNDLDTTLNSVLDGRFRWIMNDFDFSLGRGSDYNYDMAYQLGRSKLFSKLMENSSFKKVFLSRLNYCLNNIFTTQSLLKHLDETQLQLNHEMEQHLKRWGNMNTKNDWIKEVEIMKEFILKRNDFLKSKFNLPS
jgi:CotH kinase protein/Fn3 associated